MGNLIWLASYPKSGNTWLRAFLHNLMLNSERPHAINRLADLTSGDIDPARYAALAGRPAGELQINEIAALRGPVQDILAKETASSRFVKTHSALFRIAGHPTINMAVTAGAIYIIRNPLDVAISFSHHLGQSIDDVITLMATKNGHTTMTDNMMIDFVGSWSQHVESWTGMSSTTLHVMRYEDMLGAPYGSFSGVVKFLGLKAPRGRVERAVRHASFKVLREQEDKAGFDERSVHADRFFRTGRKGQWRKTLTADQIGRIVDTHGETMQKFGYVPEGF